MWNRDALFRYLVGHSFQPMPSPTEGLPRNPSWSWTECPALEVCAYGYEAAQHRVCVHVDWRVPGYARMAVPGLDDAEVYLEIPREAAEADAIWPLLLDGRIAALKQFKDAVLAAEGKQVELRSRVAVQRAAPLAAPFQALSPEVLLDPGAVGWWAVNDDGGESIRVEFIIDEPSGTWRLGVCGSVNDPSRGPSDFLPPVARAGHGWSTQWLTASGLRILQPPPESP